MSLKVLLADDSAAIKKVVQLSLQDFGVELRSVSSGKDVLDVARHYVPDIAFIDVLLPHQTGYEVAAQMKKDATLKKTPIVMLWSAFMAFDEAKFKASGADEKLEKPFEVNTLRELVTRLVPKNQTNPLSMHLDFPKMEFDTPIGAVPPQKKPVMPIESPVKPSPLPAANAMPHQHRMARDQGLVRGNPSVAPPINKDGGKETGKDDWSMGSFDDIASFSANLERGGAENRGPGASPPGGPTPSMPAPVPSAAPPPAGTSPNQHLETDFFNFGGTANKTLTSFFGAKAQAAAALVNQGEAVPTGNTSTAVAASGQTAHLPPQVASAKGPANPEPGAWNSDNNDWVRKDLGKFKVPIPEESEEENTVSFEYSENEIKNTNFLLKPTTGDGTLTTNMAAANDRTVPIISTDIATAGMPAGKGPAANSEPAANVSSNSVPRPVHAQAPMRYEVSESEVEKIKQEVRAEMREVIERIVWKLVPEIASQIIRDEITRLTNEQS